MKKFAFQLHARVKPTVTAAVAALRSSAFDLFALAGAAAFVNGVRLKSVPAAWMIAGAIVFALAVFVDVGKNRRSRS